MLFRSARVLETALRDAARRRGLEERSATVVGFVSGAAGVSGVHLADGTHIGATSVLVAGGAWTRPLAAASGIELGVVPQRGQIAHFAVEDPTVGDWPVVAPLAHNYLLAFPGRVVAGATRESDAGFDARVTAAGVQRVVDDALRVAPGLADTTLLEVRVGLRPVAERGYPLLGAVAGFPGLFVATGHGASGLTLGPWSGWAVAASAIGSEHAAELDAFSPLPSR